MAVALWVHVENLPKDAWDEAQRDTAFAELYRRCFPELTALCRRHLAGAGDPEAVAQEALLRAWLSLDSYSEERPFWPWVATIARRLCIDHGRRAQVDQDRLHHQLALGAALPSEPEQEAELSEERRAIVVALGRLRAKDQRMLALREIDGWSIEQLARFEGMTLDATRTALKRARNALRVSYERVLAGTPAVILVSALRRARATIERRLAGAPHAGSTLASTAAELTIALAVVVAAPQSVWAPVVPRDAGDPRVVLAAATPESGSGSGSSAAVDAVLATVSPVARDDVSVTAPAAARAPTDPDSGSAPRGGALLGSDRGATPEDARITSFTVSPNYAADGVVFANGWTLAGCAPQCPRLFVTRDRGATWTRLAAENFLGGEILLPPRYPDDQRIFAAGSGGLQVSSDGAQTFSSGGTPTAMAASMSPRFSQGDDRILLSSVPRWSYDAAAGVGTPAIIAGAPAGLYDVARFPSDGDGRVVVVSGTAATTSGNSRAAMFRCSDATCEPATVVGGMIGTPEFRLSPTFTRDGVAFAWRANKLFRSTDHARTFEATLAEAQLPSGSTIADLTFGPTGGFYAAVVPGIGKSDGGLFRSEDGRSWQRVTGSKRFAAGVQSVSAFPDGQVVVGLHPEGGGGLACSTDGGSTWTERCGM